MGYIPKYELIWLAFLPVRIVKSIDCPEFRIIIVVLCRIDVGIVKVTVLYRIRMFVYLFYLRCNRYVCLSGVHRPQGDQGDLSIFNKNIIQDTSNHLIN